MLWKTKPCPPIEISVPFTAKFFFKEQIVVSSMTGFGRAEVSKDGVTVSTEVRSVNSRYLDVSLKLPRTLSLREKELKDLVRTLVNRGSLNVLVKINYEADGAVPLRVNTSAAKSYYKLLKEIRKSVNLKEQIKLEHILAFSDVLEPVEEEGTDALEWLLVQDAVKQALDHLNGMRVQEGQELAIDLKKRILWMDETLNEIERLSKERIPVEREKLQERITQLTEDKFVLDQNRLELEIALLVDKLDVTEECVRYRSHNKFFLEALNKSEAAGRKLNFLVQEMNREANTIGSKSSIVVISKLVVNVKCELERMREQVQNIE